MNSSARLQIAKDWHTGSPAAAATRPRPRASNAKVRPLTEDDLESVAELFLQRFRGARRNPRAKAEVAAYMKALYLDAPTRFGDADALVSTDASGAIGAFVGGVRSGFQFDGRLIKACVSGTLMASTAPGHALAAVRLLRENRKLGYDLIVTDSANRASLAMCQAVNYQVVSPESLEWACLFAPAAVVLHKMRQRLGASWLGAFKPLAGVVDIAASVALRSAGGANRRCEWRDEPVSAEAFVEIAPRFLEPFRLRPVFSGHEFRWLIEMARQRRSAGPLNLRVVYDSAGEPAAAYASFGAKGDVARVFHAAAAPNAWGKLFDKMRETAEDAGCIGIHGALRRQTMPHAYGVRGVFFYYAGGTLAYSSRPEIRRAIEAGETFLGGFAGDRWTRLASDEFG